MVNKKQNKKTKSNPMWGGAFASSPAEILQEINQSISFDARLAKQDILASKAHCEMLIKCKIISKDAGKKIISGLNAVGKKLDSGKITFKKELEDIHMNIESLLAKEIGKNAGKLHTARSRNDQVATDFKLWVRDSIDGLEKLLEKLMVSLLNKADKHYDTIMPGFTHLQSAQPVTFGHHLMAYFEMFKRDKSRFADARKRLNECPLGAAALAGTSFPIDRNMTAKKLGFDKPKANSLDSVSDRDFAMEYLSVVSIISIHLSRLAEEITLWSSQQFNFIRLSDAFSTGSSIMPQKRNPDAAELIRAKTGRIIGALNNLLIVMKALPLAYAKDMQEDKESVFDATDTINMCVLAMIGMIDDMTINKENMLAAAAIGHPAATDLADWLVKKCSFSFREAHKITGKIVMLAEKKNCELKDLDLALMQNIEPQITREIYKILDIKNVVKARTSFGGTAPKNVKKAVKAAYRYLGK